MALVEMAQTATRKVSWNYAKKSGTKPAWDRKGEGSTELARLFYRLGWIKGHTDRAYASELVSAEVFGAAKKKLVEMAKKYDAAPMAW